MRPEAIERKDIEIIEAPGQLPTFWNHRAVFVANLLGLFFGNEEETRRLAEEVGEVDSYGGRLIPIVDLLFGGAGSNLLVLEREPDPALCRYFEETAGLSLPERVILPHRDYLGIGQHLAAGRRIEHDVVDRLSSHPAEWMDGYVTDDILAGLAEQIGKQTISSAAGSRMGNNKRELHRHLEANGFPVVMTELAESTAELEPCLARLAAAGFSSGVVKSAIGASGIGLIKVEDLSARRSVVESIPDSFFFEGPCLVQAWLKPGEQGVLEIRSPSAQLFLDSSSVAIYDLTEQILSQASVHEGNESPPPYLMGRPELRREMLRQAGEAGRWLHRQGYRGTGSVDFLVVDYDDGRTEVFVCEINARVTGATYPSILARHFLPEGAWLLRNLRFEKPLSGEELLGL
ncbi:MAG: ATP-grasp domain-containing protein, partial [Verrucomicrobiae bacterium]|nr:ATP-grasp domain-containing protein [Verrucomicrobiae bacterium]